MARRQRLRGISTKTLALVDFPARDEPMARLGSHPGSIGNDDVEVASKNPEGFVSAKESNESGVSHDVLDRTPTGRVE